ncbi:MAG: DNA repair protein RadC [Flexilinea sp.]
MIEKDEENNYTNRISDMESDERPRERLFRIGPGALSNYELIAILLRNGIPGENVIDQAKRLLSSHGGLSGLKKVSVAELSKQKGIGIAKASQVMAAVELGKRLSVMNDDNDRITIQCAENVYDFVCYEMSSFDHEELWVLNLDTRHRIIATDRLYRGSLNNSPVRVSEVFQKPIVRNAAAVILVHNHPSGDPKPSAADIAVTKSIQQAGNLLEIKMLDHIIIGTGKYCSILENENKFCEKT